MPKILRITTVPISLNVLLRGQLKFISENGFEVITASADGSEVEEIKAREGVSHHIIPFTRVISPFKDLLCLWKTYRLIRKIKPDIVHSHTPKAGLIGMMAAKLAGIKNRLHTVAGMPLMEASGITKKILTITEKITYACATNIYPNSKSLNQWIRTHLKPSQNKIHVIGEGSSNGIETNHFYKSEEIKTKAAALRNELNIAKDAVVYIFVGRLVHDKGITELVYAFNKIKNEHTHLLLVGNYEDQREPLSDIVKSLIKSDKQIHGVGFQTDIRPFLATSDIFVFPSYREGFPNVVLQACSMELPCIVSNINGCNEIIKKNVNGLIVEPKQTKLLAEAMKVLLNDVNLRNQMANTVRNSILPYNQQVVWQCLLSEYHERMNGKYNV